jgi:hypothetical protein
MFANHLTQRQLDLLKRLARRERNGGGPQTASDFDGMFLTNGWQITADGASASLERMAKRHPPLVERLDARPRTYRLTDAGREAIS